ncbi:putative hydroxymethylpyrimidine transporter CytX [Moorella sp. Hama-1]|uniref:putative hydroxymethylpyrimidine transporter CytX n=1 Tax=Moorella sp. Hama-1 TaxID=2138101 RepID=UPI000D65214A|nr:putative hydroxymethylpyrimidine transporter CytX [Moorella sp. Hama-1]BCV20094.1 cytosine permease [Moorella sp. Hama-1]
MSNNITPIPPGERTMNGLDFFLLWAGAGISLAEIMAGGFLAPLGLGMGILAILVGHVIGNTLFAAGGLIGSSYGIPAMVSTRPAFGVRGSYLGALLNILQLIGWTAIMLIVAARAADSLGQHYLGTSHLQLWTVIIGLATTAWAWAGRRSWPRLQKLVTTLLILFSLYMTYVIFRGPGWGHLWATRGDSSLGFGLATDLVIAMPLSWLPLAADYSRFARDNGSSFAGSWLGYFLASSWMYILGLGATLATGSADPIPMMLGLGLGLPALYIIFFSTVTTTFMDVYSAAISSLDLFSGWDERHTTMAAGLAGTLIALLFPMEAYENFLLLIGGAFCPLFGIVLTDYFIYRRGRLEVDNLFGRGAFWYTGGVNLVAVIIWLLGFLFFQWLTRTSFPLGASVPSLVVTGGVYYVAMFFYRQTAWRPGITRQHEGK